VALSKAFPSLKLAAVKLIAFLSIQQPTPSGWEILNSCNLHESCSLLVTNQVLDAQLLTFKGVIFSPKSLICNVSRMPVCLFVTVIFLAKSL